MVELKQKRWSNIKEWTLLCGLELTIISALLIISFTTEPADRIDITGMNITLCQFSNITGLSCPSCGLTRACVCVAHGEVVRAVAFNPFIVLLLPFILFRLCQRLCETFTNKYPVIKLPLAVYITIGICFLVFGIARIVIEMAV